jgi:hypothetical protein
MPALLEAQRFAGLELSPCDHPSPHAHQRGGIVQRGPVGQHYGSALLGGSTIDMNRRGVFITGTMVFINSGAASVSAPDASPQSPDSPTAPKDPDTADNGSKGTKLN